MSHKTKALLYIDRNYFSYFTETSVNVIQFAFPQNIVKDLEVINTAELDKQIKTLIDTNKLIPTILCIILSDNVVFIKDIPGSQENMKDTVDHFLNNVPFENISTKIYKLDKISRITAVNEDLYGSIKSSLEKYGFTIESVVPAFMIKNANFTNGFTAQIAKLIFSQTNILKQANIADFEPVLHMETSSSEKKTLLKDPKNRRTLLLLGIFGVLILVLLVVLIITFFGGQKSQKKAAPRALPQTQIVQSPTPIQETSTGTNSASLNPEDLSVQVLNGSGVSGQAQRVRAALAEFDITNVEIGNATGVTSSNTLVLFAPRVPRAIRESILEVLEELFEDVSSQESSDIQVDLVITTGKPK